MAATFSLPARTPLDLAPTLCSLEGFPASREMPGRAVDNGTPRIASYGARQAAVTGSRVNDEYYRSLRSLGYIR